MNPGKALLLALFSLAVASADAGEKPFDFTLEDMEGKRVTLSDHTGRDVIFINFWATWCTPCVAELLFLERLHDKYSGKGLKIFAINVDELKDRIKVRGLVKSKGLTIPVLFDPSTTVLSLYNPSKVLPFSLIIRRDGTIESRNFGYNPEEEKGTEEKIRMLLDEGEGG